MTTILVIVVFICIGFLGIIFQILNVKNEKQRVDELLRKVDLFVEKVNLDNIVKFKNNNSNISVDKKKNRIIVRYEERSSVLKPTPNDFEIGSKIDVNNLLRVPLNHSKTKKVDRKHGS